MLIPRAFRPSCPVTFALRFEAFLRRMDRAAMKREARQPPHTHLTILVRSAQLERFRTSAEWKQDRRVGGHSAPGSGKEGTGR